jgi:hypothetical protein
MGEISHQLTKSPLCSTHCFMTRIRAWTCFGHFVTMRLPFYNQTRQIWRIPSFRPPVRCNYDQAFNAPNHFSQ